MEYLKHSELDRVTKRLPSEVVIRRQGSPTSLRELLVCLPETFRSAHNTILKSGALPVTYGVQRRERLGAKSPCGFKDR